MSWLKTSSSGSIHKHKAASVLVAPPHRFNVFPQTGGLSFNFDDKVVSNIQACSDKGHIPVLGNGECFRKDFSGGCSFSQGSYGQFVVDNGGNV